LFWSGHQLSVGTVSEAVGNVAELNAWRWVGSWVGGSRGQRRPCSSSPRVFGRKIHPQLVAFLTSWSTHRRFRSVSAWIRTTQHKICNRFLAMSSWRPCTRNSIALCWKVSKASRKKPREHGGCFTVRFCAEHGILRGNVCQGITLAAACPPIGSPRTSYSLCARSCPRQCRHKWFQDSGVSIDCEAENSRDIRLVQSRCAEPVWSEYPNSHKTKGRLRPSRRPRLTPRLRGHFSRVVCSLVRPALGLI